MANCSSRPDAFAVFAWRFLLQNVLISSHRRLRSPNLSDCEPQSTLTWSPRPTQLETSGERMSAHRGVGQVGASCQLQGVPTRRNPNASIQIRPARRPRPEAHRFPHLKSSARLPRAAPPHPEMIERSPYQCLSICVHPDEQAKECRAFR